MKRAAKLGVLLGTSCFRNRRTMFGLVTLKGAQWMAKHRGIGGEKGFVQIGLAEAWGAAHLEWRVNTKSMLCGNRYKLELHVEGKDNRNLADQWRKLFREQSVTLPSNCTIGKGSRTFLVYEAHTDTPIAKMNKKELESFLKKVYLEELKACCRMLVEDFGNYNH